MINSLNSLKKLSTFWGKDHIREKEYCKKSCIKEKNYYQKSCVKEKETCKENKIMKVICK
jgi:hypothetical protein